MHRLSIHCLLYSVVAFSLCNSAYADIAPPRTLEELKAETQARADRNAYPLTGLRPDEVREALAAIKSPDRDAWAAAWSAIGDRYLTQERAQEKAAPAAARENYLQAWRYYSFARWPVPNSPGKQQAYRKAIGAFLAHGRLLDPPLGVLRIPFEGKDIVAYRQMPKTAQPAPVVIAIGGLDSRKEDMAERFQPMLAHGAGYVAVDMPGTGESPLKIAPGAERVLSRLLDAVTASARTDKSRVAIYGGSFGGYWSTILAATERDRVKAVFAQSPPIHETFSAAALERAMSNKEYLFDYIPAYMSVYAEVETLDDLRAARAKASLQAQGILGRAMAPLLVIGGVHDTQAPIADIDLLLHSGETPKEAWINPAGGHMGRESRGWTDPVIFKRVTMPWLLRALEVRVE